MSDEKTGFWTKKKKLSPDICREQYSEWCNNHTGNTWPSRHQNQWTTKTGVSPQKVKGWLISDPTEKVEVLNSQFQSAFSEGWTYSRDELQTKCKIAEGSYSELDDFTITLEGVRRQLGGINPYNTPIPDGISLRILQELDQIRLLPHWWPSSSHHFKQAIYHPTGRKPMLHTSVCSLSSLHLFTYSPL